MSLYVPGSIAEQRERVAATERALAERLAQVAILQERADRAEAALRRQARAAKAAGAQLSTMTAELNARMRDLDRTIQQTETRTYLASLPNNHGGPDGLYAAAEEIARHERRKKRLARQAAEFVTE